MRRLWRKPECWTGGIGMVVEEEVEVRVEGVWELGAVLFLLVLLFVLLVVKEDDDDEGC